MQARYTKHILYVALTFLLLTSCKKENNDFYAYSTPGFAVYQKAGEEGAFYGYCASHDVYLDSVYVIDPLNIRSQMYFQGERFSREVHFLIGDTFVEHPGLWKFTFYGRKTINGLAFSVYLEKEF
jgi:hypothetical protein